MCQMLSSHANTQVVKCLFHCNEGSEYLYLRPSVNMNSWHGSHHFLFSVHIKSMSASGLHNVAAVQEIYAAVGEGRPDHLHT